MLEFPNEFLFRMKDLLKDEFDAFLSSLNQEREKAIFVNENKISVQDFLSLVKNDSNFPLEKIDYEKAGFYIGGIKLGKHPLHHAGAFYIQEPNAMFTVNSYSFKGNEYVLDMCASPGGKSIQIANRIPDGILVSNEYVTARSQILFSNIERMGLKNVIITNDTPENVASAYAGCFDVVLVDAPCSGEGMFRRGEKVIDEWNVGLAKKCQARQLNILNQADKAVKQDGVIIYSTCTYSLEENEEVIQMFLSTHNYKLLDIPKNEHMSSGIVIDNVVDYKKCVRLYPHKSRGEGQFVAVMKKIDANNLIANGNEKLNKSIIANNFLKENLTLNLNPRETNNKIFHIINENMIKRGVNYITKGVLLGELVKNRFVLAHNLFTAYGNQFKKIINLNYKSNELLKYIRGDVVDITDFDGYGTVLVDNCALGGFKISDSKFKNHYPKGLRI